METPIDRIETPRMVGERISREQFEEVRRLHRDPVVMRTLSADGQVVPDELTLRGLQSQEEHWEQHGYGLWVFRARTDGRFIGRGGLKEHALDIGRVPGLAYAVMSPEWGKGYASEMAAATLRVGFEQLGFPEIFSWTLPINLASQRVMEKLGFQYERDFEFAGLPHRFYRLTRDEWELARRGAEIRSGNVVGEPADAVFARLRRRWG